LNKTKKLSKLKHERATKEITSKAIIEDPSTPIVIVTLVLPRIRSSRDTVLDGWSVRSLW